MRLLGGVPITGRVRETPQGGEARKKLNSSARHHDVPSTAIREESDPLENPTRWGKVPSPGTRWTSSVLG